MAVAPPTAEHRLKGMWLRVCSSQALEHRLSSCSAQASWIHGMWDLPGPGFKPMSSVLACRFFTTEPPGKSSACSL